MRHFSQLQILIKRLVALVLQAGVPVVLVDVHGLPGIVDPDVADGLSSDVTGVEHVVGELSLLGLVLVL
jgi:hypothetical protein